MEAFLRNVDEQEKQGTLEKYSRDDVAQALGRFTDAIRRILDTPRQEEKEEGGDDVAINAAWLLRLCKKIPSELGPEYLARAVWEASQLSDESQQQEALFMALGASEEAMDVLFQTAPHLSAIKKNIRPHELGDDTDHQGPIAPAEIFDEEEMTRQRLRQEALDAAQVAAIARAEADAAVGPSMSGTTHTITRSSDVKARKMAEKAAKRAAQALQRAKDAGAIIEESEYLAVENVAVGSGGLIGSSVDDLRALQQSLLPEGSRKYYTEQGLPDGTIHEDNAEIGYERVTIPPPVRDLSKLHARLNISDVLDEDCAYAFAGTQSLNPMQSTVFETAFHRRENMLVCAPTGAGKTNVAMLTVTAHFRDVGLIGDGEGMETGKKVVYIAPMKALAQEVVEKFTSKLKPLGLIVRELTGDMQLTRAEAQSANVLVTTPEKWDVVTRKSGNDENSLGNQCGLLIIDEVHLLADERGAVIESVVSRLHRLVESRQKQLRIVGLSATLPNYEDVAEFLQVPQRGLFYFGPEHRPVPLQQTFIGVTGSIRNRSQIEEKMNDVCYETVKDSLARGYQVMVFVHSRKGTSDTATELATRASAAQELDRYFTTQGQEGRAGDAYKRYADRIKKSRNREVANHFFNGMGIHHAGMLRSDRKLSESMFADGAIKVLCCTATLAWGINLPAHTVVIKGTDVYNPEKGKNMDLSILDVQQIFGRAGRPQFDSSGEATLITNHAALTRYLDKLVRAVPIESTFIKQLIDHLNAEIVGGTVTNINEAATWLSYSYLYVRMLKNPLAYGISGDEKADDPMLRGRCLELVKQAALDLASNKMINYHEGSGNLGMTTLGRVAAHFYIRAESVSTFNESLGITGSPTDAGLLKMVASASEFENVRVRQEEQSELDTISGNCPLELLGPVHDAATKTFVLIQAFISRERPKSFTLISDTNYIASNAGRVARAMFEMCLNSNDSATALKLLRLAKSVDNQFWWFQTPLRHFEDEVSVQVVKSIENREGRSESGYDTLATTLSLLDMTPEEVGNLCRSKKEIGRKVQRFVGMIPRPEVSCRVLPVTADVLRFQVEIKPNFEWHGRWHGGALSFWLWVEDVRSERICHQEQILFAKKTHPESKFLDFPIPAFSSDTTQYLLRIVSDSWVGVEVVHPVSLQETKMPEQKSTYTDLIDLTPLPTTVLQDEKYERLFDRIETFNPVQTQLFHVLYHTDTPVLLGAPTGSGKTVIAELALLRMKRIHKNGICVYIAPLKSLARERLKEWQSRFGSEPMRWNVLELSGDTHHDRHALQKADVLVCTPEKWDLISRGWKRSQAANAEEQAERRSFVKRVRLLVIDEIHLLGEERGAVLEAIVSRTRYISRYLQEQNVAEKAQDASGTGNELVRIVGLSTAVANPLDLADWIGINTAPYGATAMRGLYNFRPSIRPVPTKIHVQAYPGKHYCPRMATMNKPCYAAIKQHAPDRPSLIFVASRRQTRLTAFDIISYAAGDENPKQFLGCDESYVEAIAETIHDDALKHTICFGIGLHHAGLSSHDRDIVERMYLNGEIRVLVATATLAWGVNLPARLVIVKGTEYFDGKVSRYVDYPLTDVLQMIGRAGRPGFDTEGRAVVLVETSKKNFYKKFLFSPFPVESCLKGRLNENLNAEIATGTVASLVDAVGYLSWTFFARRVKANPSYYGAKSGGASDVEEFLILCATNALKELQSSGCIESGNMGADTFESVQPTSLGVAGSDYYLTYRTSKQMQLGLKEGARLVVSELLRIATTKAPNQGMTHFASHQRVDEVAICWLLYTLCCTHEFDEVPVRHNEEILNEELSEDLLWGADATSVLAGNRTAGYIDPDVYADPHTKTFLLLQAHIEKARLPISDYVNDTKAVLDNVPRLLAAMQYIATKMKKCEGNFEVVCQLYKARQLIASRLPLDLNPILAMPSADETLVHGSLASNLGDGVSEESFLWCLRQMDREAAADVLKKSTTAKKQKGSRHVLRIRDALDWLYQKPRVSVELGGTKVTHKVDKQTNASRGVLALSLKIDRMENDHTKRANKKGDARHSSLAIVVGTAEKRLLLAHTEVTVSRGGTWTVEKELEFDWDLANAHGGEGGGFVVCRFMLDNVRGLDSEISIRLR